MVHANTCDSMFFLIIISSFIATLRLKIARVMSCDHDLATLLTQEDNKQAQNNMQCDQIKCELLHCSLKN